MPILPMFPLGTALLPGSDLPLRIFEPRYQQLVEDCTASPDGPRFGVVLIARGHEVGGGDQRHGVGTVARIMVQTDLGGGRRALECIAEERIRVTRWLPDDPYPRAEAEVWPDTDSGPVDFASITGPMGRLYGALDRLTTVGLLYPLPPPSYRRIPARDCSPWLGTCRWGKPIATRFSLLPDRPSAWPCSSTLYPPPSISRNGS